jgi:outer membrane protein TolC
MPEPTVDPEAAEAALVALANAEKSEPAPAPALHIVSPLIAEMQDRLDADLLRLEADLDVAIAARNAAMADVRRLRAEIASTVSVRARLTPRHRKQAKSKAK